MELVVLERALWIAFTSQFNKRHVCALHHIFGEILQTAKAGAVLNVNAKEEQNKRNLLGVNLLGPIFRRQKGVVGNNMLVGQLNMVASCIGVFHEVAILRWCQQSFCFRWRWWASFVNAVVVFRVVVVLRKLLWKPFVAFSIHDAVGDRTGVHVVGCDDVVQLSLSLIGNSTPLWSVRNLSANILPDVIFHCCDAPLCPDPVPIEGKQHM